MKILAVDTTTNLLCLGLYDDGKAYEYALDLGRKHSKLITVSIERVLKAVGLDIRSIDYFAVGLGPGSFTGLRVGVATIKGLAWALKKPVVGVPTLDVIAQNALSFNPQEVAVVEDARRNLLYCGFYKFTDKVLKLQKPYMLIGVDEFCALTKPKTLILGDAIKIHGEHFRKEIKDVLFLDHDYWRPQANHLLHLALKQIGSGKITNSFKVEPIYLYPKECQIKPIK